MKTIIIGKKHIMDRQSLRIQSALISKTTYQAGFTLVELMIALVLGLLIAAAALQIFYTSSVNARRQEAGSQIQDNSIFGLTDLQYRLRRINYGARTTSTGKKFFMNHLTPQGGIVLTAPDGKIEITDNKGQKTKVDGWSTGNLYGLKLDGKPIDKELLSKNASKNSSSNLEGMANSDQLTIQYQTGIDGTFDCQGRSIPKDYYVVERYFVRKDVDTKQNGLACASAIYKYDETLANSAAGIDIKEYIPPGETIAKPNNLSGKGEIVIPNVDYFRVLLGISSNDNFAIKPESVRMAYIPIPADADAILNNNRIVSMQIGLLTHSNNPTATGQANDQLRFNILDKTNKSLNDSTKKGPTYLRNVYENTILFRNARGGV